MIDNRSVPVKWKSLIHFAAGKMTGGTIFYKDGFNLLFKINPFNRLFRDFRRRNRNDFRILKVARLKQQYPTKYEQTRFHVR